MAKEITFKDLESIEMENISIFTRLQEKRHSFGRSALRVTSPPLHLLGSAGTPGRPPEASGGV